MPLISSRRPAKTVPVNNTVAADDWSRVGSVSYDEGAPARTHLRPSPYAHGPRPVDSFYGRAAFEGNNELETLDFEKSSTHSDFPDKPLTSWTGTESEHLLGQSTTSLDRNMEAWVTSVQHLSSSQVPAVEGASRPLGQVYKEPLVVLNGLPQPDVDANEPWNLPEQQPLARSYSDSRRASGYGDSRTHGSESQTNLSRHNSMPRTTAKSQPLPESHNQPRQSSLRRDEQGSLESRDSSENPPSPPMQAGEQAGETDFSQLRLLPHIAELDERARILDLKEPSVGLDIKYLLKLASQRRHEAKNHVVRRRLSEAFIAYDRAAIIILQRIPAHPTYFKVLNPRERENLNFNGQDILAHLSALEKEISRSADHPLLKADRETRPVESAIPTSSDPSGSPVTNNTSKDRILKHENTPYYPKPSSARQDIDLLQEWLDDNTSHPQRQSTIKRLLDYATQADDNLPSNLLIHGVIVEQGDRPVASGSFADVYLGVYGKEQVAVKRFRSFLSTDGRDKIYKRFCREALLWRQLNHPRILPFLGIDWNALSSKRALIMISPWMARGTLLKYLERAGSAVLRQIPRDLIMDIAEGLKYLHDQSLAHGDLHGSNVFVDDNGRALLGDFGLTAVTDMANLSATTTINKAGAIRWLGPELLQQDDGPPPRKTSTGDIFAFGRLCLCVYTRRAPYHTIQNDAGVLLRVIQNRHPSQPTEKECHGTAMPRGLWDLILQCWKGDPKARPTVNEVVESLGPILRRGGA